MAQSEINTFRFIWFYFISWFIGEYIRGWEDDIGQQFWFDCSHWWSNQEKQACWSRKPANTNLIEVVVRVRSVPWKSAKTLMISVKQLREKTQTIALISVASSFFFEWDRIALALHELISFSRFRCHLVQAVWETFCCIKRQNATLNLALSRAGNSAS